MAETVTFKNIFKKTKLKNLFKCKKFAKCSLQALKLVIKPTHFSFEIFGIKKIKFFNNLSNLLPKQNLVL